MFLEGESIICNAPLQNMSDKYLGLYVPQNEPNTGNVKMNHRIQMAQMKDVNQVPLNSLFSSRL